MAATVGLEPTIELVQAKDLRKPRYQRILMQGRVESIAGNLDWLKFGTLVGSRREDGIYLVDGQHRWEGLLMNGHHDDQIAVLVYHGLTEMDELVMYEQQTASGRRPLSAMDKLWGRKQVGDPDALALIATIERAGFTMDFSRNWHGQKGLRAADTLIRVRDDYGLDHLYETLTLLADTFPDNPTAWRSDVINGFARFLAEYGDDDKYERDWFTSNLHALGVTAFLREADNQRNSLAQHTSVGRSLYAAKAAVLAYNSKCQTSRQLDAWEVQLKKNRQRREGRKPIRA